MMTILFNIVIFYKKIMKKYGLNDRINYIKEERGIIMKLFKENSIKFKITIIIMFSIGIVTLLISLQSFITFRKILNNKLKEVSKANLTIVSNNIDNDILQVTHLASWCSINSLVTSFVTSPTDDKSNGLSLNTYYRVKEELNNSKVSRYISRLIITNENGNLIQITADSGIGNLSDGTTTKELDYFQELIEYKGFKWIGIKSNPFVNFNEEYIIPVIRPIYGYNNNDIEGWVYIGLSTRIITDYLETYNLEGESEILINIGDNIYSYSNKYLIEIEDKHNENDFKNKSKGEDIITYDKENNKGDTLTYIWKDTSFKDIKVGQSISQDQFKIEINSFISLMVIIIFILFILAISLTILFDRLINKPVNKIYEKVLNISIGDFKIDKDIESEDEIGSIGKGINVLCERISELINNKIEDEKYKKDLEFKVLQNQINPHFLYNTLNSIKWMAVIQNTTGIPEMTTSLARLLKNIAKGTDQLISIEEELSLLSEYITIQKYKYGGALDIDFDVENENLYKNKLIKFTLQPLVENAIFHGIEPKGIHGKIKIKIFEEKEDKIIIKIVDNGIGIDEDKIKDILEGINQKENKSFNNIGIKNVNERIKLTFGEEYGITIESEINEFTIMKIILPKI